MADRKYYVICEQGCRFESMTKEQILTAIAQAVENGEVKDVDTGFVQTIKTINGVGLHFFVGEQSEYELLSDEEKQNLFAIITNDTTKESLLATIEAMSAEIEALKKQSIRGEPTLNSEKTLPSPGYYYIRMKGALTQGQNHPAIDFGVLYWDGTSFAYLNLIRRHVLGSGALLDYYSGAVNALGNLIAYKGTDLSGGFSNITDEVDFYTAKIAD